jgi:PAS domain S-box-containing protein
MMERLQIYDDAPIAVAAYDVAGRLIYVNVCFEASLSRSAAELTGQHFLSVYALENSEGIEAEIARSMEESGRWTSRVTATSADGSAIVWNLALQAIRDSSGETTHYLAWHREIPTSPRIDNDLIVTLAEASALVTQRMDADTLMKQMNLLIRRGLGVDRAGIWRLESDGLVGTWGTDEAGHLIDERHHTRSIVDLEDPLVRSAILGKTCLPEGSYKFTAPILVNGRVIGVLSVDNTITKRPIPDGIAMPASLFTDYLGIGLRNAFTQKEIEIATRRSEKLAEQLQNLLKVTQDLVQNWVPDLLFQEITQCASRLLETSCVDLYRFGEDGLAFLAGSQIPECHGNECLIPRDRPLPLVENAILQGTPIVTSELESSANYSAEWHQEIHPGVRARIIMPIRAGETPLGALVAIETRRARHYTEEEVMLASHLAASAAVTIRGAEHIAEIERLNADLKSKLIIERELSEQRARTERLEGVLQTVRMFNHEINNPLQVTLGNAQLLENLLKDQPNAMRLLNRLMLGCQRLSDVAIRLSRVVRATSRPTPVGEMLDLESASSESD